MLKSVINLCLAFKRTSAQLRSTWFKVTARLEANLTKQLTSVMLNNVNSRYNT